MQFIDLQSQYKTLKQRIDARIQTVLDHGKYILGPEVTELEAELAKYVGVKHAITCANGTDALQLALMSLNIGQGDAVFCPTFTFFATAEVIALCQATPVFVDSNEQTFNICPKSLEQQIQNVLAKGEVIPKAIIAVDLFGLPADYTALQVIANKYGLKLIEDAAQGFGGAINNKRAGSFGDIATTSFFPAKPLGCYGDGGAVFTDDNELADLLRSYRVHGKGTDKYDNVRIGLNSRLDTIQAAILLEKLTAFPGELINRNNAAEHYTSLLGGLFQTPYVPQGYLSSWAQYTLVAENRDEIIASLKNDGIPSMVYYATCMHQQTAFTHMEYKVEDFPIAERLSRQVFSLPMHGYIVSKDIAAVRDVLSECSIQISVFSSN